MFNPQEFPEVYSWISGYVRVGRDLLGIPKGISSNVTPEDCCIFIAWCVEWLLEWGGWSIVDISEKTGLIRAIVWSKISNQSEASKFAERYVEDIFRIVTDITVS